MIEAIEEHFSEVKKEHIAIALKNIPSSWWLDIAENLGFATISQKTIDTVIFYFENRDKRGFISNFLAKFLNM